MEEVFFFIYHLHMDRDTALRLPINERKWMIERFIQQKQKENDAKRHVKKATENTSGTSTGKPLDEPDPYSGQAPDDEEIRASELALQADQEMMYKLLEADDALATSYEEIKRLNYLNSQMEIRFHGLMNEKNEAVKMVKKLQKEIDKLKGKK